MSPPVSTTASAGGLPADGSATVIIGQRVRRGRADEYRRWQGEIDATVATFPGFLGTEVTPPAGEEGDWTVIYRFDSIPHLNAWLGSPTRERLLAGAADLLVAPPTQHVMVGEQDERLVTVVVSHAVDPRHEAEFLAWQERLTAAERHFPGFRGAELFRPVPGLQESWTAVYRFASSEDLDRWLDSREREELLREGEHFQDFELRKVANSFGSWFSFADPAEVVTSSWKTALSVLVGLYPTVVLLTLAIDELWERADLWQSLLLGNLLSVSLLTWVVMPLVRSVLHFWLVPARDAVQPRTDVLGTAVAIALLTVAAFVFWLVTVEVWTLP